MRPKKSRRSTTASWMVAAFTENFDQITRNERCSPALKGTAAGAGDLLVFGDAGRFERLDRAAKHRHAQRRTTRAPATIPRVPPILRRQSFQAVFFFNASSFTFEL